MPSYGSTTYGAYGSYSSITSARDILSPSGSHSSSSNNSSARSSYSCAFPSWPRRSSLSEADSDPERASAYLSDEDLDWTFSAASDPFEDSDARSVSSSSTEGGGGGGNTSPRLAAVDAVVATAAQLTEADLEELERERAAYQREVMRFLLNEKERRRQQAAMARRSTRGSGNGASSSSSTVKPSSSAKKSPRSKLSAMTPIAEAE